MNLKVLKTWRSICSCFYLRKSLSRGNDDQIFEYTYRIHSSEKSLGAEKYSISCKILDLINGFSGQEHKLSSFISLFLNNIWDQEVFIDNLGFNMMSIF